MESPLRKIRRQRGLSVEQLADKAGVSPTLIILRERTTRGTIGLKNARSIAAALDVSVDTLWPEGPEAEEVK